MSDLNIVYLDLAAFDDQKVLRGGALVTDSTTEPLEFRCTDAVRPTALQQILWGARLDGHVAANIIGLPLLRKISQDYGLVVVKNPDFLEVRLSIEQPVILMLRDSAIEFEEPDRRTNAQWALDMAKGPEEAGADGESEAVLANPSGRFEPVILQCHPGYPNDRPTAREALAPVFGQRDVFEPFSRIAAALESVHEQKLGE